MLVHFLPMKSREGLAHDVFDIFATYSSPAPGATGTDRCLTQNCSSCSHIFQLSIAIFNKQDQKLSEK